MEMGNVEAKAKKKLSLTTLDRLDRLIEKSKGLSDLSSSITNDIVGNYNGEIISKEESLDKNGFLNDILRKINTIETYLDGIYHNLDALREEI